MNLLTHLLPKIVWGFRSTFNQTVITGVSVILPKLYALASVSMITTTDIDPTGAAEVQAQTDAPATVPAC